MNKDPNTGQKEENIQDYPLPPGIEDSSKHVRIIFNGTVIAETDRAKRILEKGHPPVYYFPPEDVKSEYLTPAENHTFCLWKGEASYYHLTVKGKTARYACWYYPDPKSEFILIKNYLAFYTQKMDACYLDDELVSPEPNKYYGGWITKGIVGPFKED